ncbi:MAG TPA: tetratricopeptide repeat protein [Ferruginibacter sp.]|nr:tetratricopeptide repeat protein [Ferruginibacter sp.]HRO16661.1 tetratricopeptide repeat protein [Ferruginibacter sp.]HRQ19717.1 tetratricopeptide repeat protein [Ferruginibacter sp.]
MKPYCLFLLLLTPLLSRAQISDVTLQKINDAIFTSPQSAKKSSDSLLLLYPNNYKVVNIAGNVCWENGDRNGAVRFYTQSLQIEPKQMTAYRRMAEFFEEKGMYDRALEYLNKGIEQKPDAELYSKRAMVHFSMKNYLLSKADDEKAITLKNDDIYNYANAALSAFMLKENNPTRYFDEAEKITTIPRPELWLRRGIYFAAGPADYASAKFWFDKIFQGKDLPHFSAGDLNLMGITCYKNKEYSNAEKLFKASLQRKEDPDVMGNLASVYVDQQAWNTLLIFAKSMLDQFPNHVMANAFYGVALIRTGQSDLGEQYIKKAEQLQQKN